MNKTFARPRTSLWPARSAVYFEALVIILLVIVLLFLQFGQVDFQLLLSYHALLMLVGSLCAWFANRYTLGRILQTRIEANRLTRSLPFELMGTSVVVTSIIYIVIYAALIILTQSNFVLAKFLQGFTATIGFSLLIALLYLGIHVWQSWWTDGEFIFPIKEQEEKSRTAKDFITIENARGSVNVELAKVHYFFSDSKIVFMVDESGKKWITQFNLTQLENTLDDRFFRLNRSILVNRSVISEVKKLPNHRLLVTVGQTNSGHQETISRYKSTRFKQWFSAV